jgi:hypothetical protein
MATMAFNHEALGRLYGFAVIDIVGTVAIAYWLHPSWQSVVGALVIGELVHLALRIETPVTRTLAPV